MKKIILAIAVVIGLSAISCKKEEAAVPQTPAVTEMINVEYRISNQSGLVDVIYMYPNADGHLEAKPAQISRTYETIGFEFESGNFFSIEASNVVPAYKTVQVEIYVDGVLMAKDISSSPSQKAIASGNY